MTSILGSETESDQPTDSENLTAAAEQAAPTHEHEIIDTALASIDSLLNASMWTLTIFAIVIAILGAILAGVAIFGWGVIKQACLTAVTKKAEIKLTDFLGSEEFKQLLEDKIQKSVEARWQSTVVLQHLKAPEKSKDYANPFPTKPERSE